MLVRMIISTVDPLTDKIRRKLPWLGAGGLDFSPLVLTFGLILLQYILVGTLLDYAHQIRLSI